MFLSPLSVHHLEQSKVARVFLSYRITLQEKEKLNELNLPQNFKKKMKVEPCSGTILPHTEKIIEVCGFSFLPSLLFR